MDTQQELREKIRYIVLSESHRGDWMSDLLALMEAHTQAAVRAFAEKVKNCAEDYGSSFPELATRISDIDALIATLSPQKEGK